MTNMMLLEHKYRTNMKRTLITMAMSVMSLWGFGACSDSNVISFADSGDSGSSPSSTSRIETTTAVASDYFKAASQQGTVELVNYESKDYTQSDRPVTHKPAYVYLPYGYDASKKYDIIYLMHGWTGTAQEYFGMSDRQQMKNLFDNMIQHGDCKPFIAVSPTWDKDNQSKGWSESTDEIAVFFNEYENDLIPAIESRYSTYAETTDHAGIVASRDHRAFGGFSLGSVTTWYIFEYCFDLQRYFLPMSGDSWHVEMFGGAYAPEETARFLASVVDASQFKNAFHVWHAVGTADVRYDQTHNQGMAMMQLPEFGPSVYSYHERPNGQHDMNSVWEFCYNAIPEFFPTNNSDMANDNYYSRTSKITDVVNDPVFGDYGRLIFPVDDGYWSGNTLEDLHLVWYNNIDPDKTVEIVNYMHSHAAKGDTIFYSIYSDAEKAANPELRNTGLFFFKGNEGSPVAVCNAGGGFAYVGAMQDSYPHALELSKKGYNAFALIYRPDYAYADLARAIEFICDNASMLGVNANDYSLWGGSAGARMAATLGNRAYLRQLTGRTDIPQAKAVIMQYTGYSAVSQYDAPTYACVGTSDGIASWRTMQNRLQQLSALGIPTEFHVYNGLPHGFGLGVGTVAEGWIDDAVDFWRGQSGTTGVSRRIKVDGNSGQSHIYGLDGLRRDAIHRGINIVNGRKIIRK